MLESKKQNDIVLCTTEQLEKLPIETKNFLLGESRTKSYANFVMNGKKFQTTEEMLISSFTDNKYDNIKLSISNENEVSDMSNGSFDTLFQELKADMREREERSRREISEREERFKEQLSSYAQEASKREERFTALIQEIKSDMRESEKRISENIFNSEQRINDTEKRLQETVTNLENTMRTAKNQNLAVNIALFVGMLAIVITLIIAVFVQN